MKIQSLKAILEELDSHVWGTEVTRNTMKNREDLPLLQQAIEIALVQFASGRHPKTDLCAIDVALDFGDDKGDHFFSFFDANTMEQKPEYFDEDTAKPMAYKIAKAIEKKTDIQNMRSWMDAESFIITVMQYKP